MRRRRSVRPGWALGMAAFLAACGGETPPAPASAPTVLSTSPVRDATDVDAAAPIRAEFSRAMNPATLTTETFRVSLRGLPVAGTVRAQGTSATFEAAEPLAAATRYSVVVTQGARDVGGRSLAADFAWRFTTAPPPRDTTAPTLVTAEPAADATLVPVTAALRVTFSEAMDAATLGPQTFQLTLGPYAFAGRYEVAGEVATFTPGASLQYGTTYTVRLGTGVKDRAGNPLAAEQRWQFTTLPAPPTVEQVSPPAGALEADVATPIEAVFSRPMDPATLTAATFFVEGRGGRVGGTVSSDGAAATFRPAVRLGLAGLYTATLTTGAKDSSGIPLGEPYRWSFRVRDGTFAGFESIGADSGGSVTTPSVTLGAGATAVVVWGQGTSANWRTYANRHVPGLGWGRTEALSSISNATVSGASVAASGGPAFALWFAGSPDEQAFWAARLDPATGWSPAARVSEPIEAGTVVWTPSLAVDPQGNAVGLWGFAAGGAELAGANRYTVAQGWGTPRRLSEAAMGTVMDTALSLDGSGRGLALWLSARGTTSQLWAARLGVGGEWQPHELVASSDVRHHWRPRLAMNPSGEAWASWTESDAQSATVWVQRYQPAAGWGPATLLSSVFAEELSVAVHADGGALAVWIQVKNAVGEVWWSRFRPATGWAQPDRLSEENAGDYFGPRLAMDDAGNAIALWTQRGVGISRVVASRYVDELGWTVPRAVDSGATGTAALALAPDGRAAMVWSRGGGPAAVQLRRFDCCTGPPGPPLDGGTLDGGTLDGGTLDGGALDGGPLDGGALDGGALDGGALDGGTLDGGALDGGALDGGPLDGGALDGGTSSGCGFSTSDGGGARYVECETTGARSNDTFATAVVVGLPVEIEGSIAAPDAGGADEDVYRLATLGAELLRVTLTAGETSSFQPYFELRDGAAPGRASRVGRPGGNPRVATRELWLPEAREYFLVVRDLRNDGSAPPLGGAGFAYSLQLERVALAPTPASLPYSATATVASDGRVAALQLSPGAGAWFLTAETFAERLAPASNVDTILHLVDTSGLRPTTVASSDDTAGTRDARLAAALTAPGPFVVIVDHRDIDGPARGYELRLAALGPGPGESEPNDSAADANALSSGACVSGALTANGPAGDVDFFSLQATAGTAYELLLTRTAGANPAFAPILGFLDPNGTTTFVHLNGQGRGSVRLEAYAFVSGVHTVFVADRSFFLTPQPAGGSDFTYRLAVLPGRRVVTPLDGFPVGTQGPSPTSRPGRIDEDGKTAWFSFVVPAGPDRLVTVELDLGATGGANGFDLNPTLGLVGSDGQPWLAGGSALTGGKVLVLRDVRVAPGTHTLLVSDADGASSLGRHAFRPRIRVEAEVGHVTNAGGHGTPATALPLLPLPTLLGASLTPGDSAWYALGALRAGAALKVRPLAPDSVNPAGVWLSVHRASDLAALAPPFFVVDATLPSDGEYLLQVSGAMPMSGGDYLLFVDARGCGPAGPSANDGLYLNELFARPGQSGGDANGDGVSSPADDRFVEVMSAARRVVELSGLELRDAAGARYRAACGDTVSSGGALTVFSACPASGAPCDSARVANAAPEGSAASGLGLDPGGGLVLLVNAGGQILDRVVYEAAAENVSWARGAGGVCDEAPTSRALQPHTQCIGAIGGRSPGARADGSSLGPAPGDTCTNAILLISGQTRTGETTAARADDYHLDPMVRPPGCTYDDPMMPTRGLSPTSHYPGPDAAYSIEVGDGRTLTVTLHPTSGWNPALILTAECLSLEQSCLAASDLAGPMGDETVRYTNLTGATRTWLLLVDSADGSSGSYDLTALVE